MQEAKEVPGAATKGSAEAARWTRQTFELVQQTARGEVQEGGGKSA